MSLFNWFPGKKKSTARKTDQGLSRKSSSLTRPPTISPRKGLRIKRREQLFAVVRESMIRGGVLSTSYEFKVLTLDATGDHFLVLIDLALPAQSLQDEHLAEVERWIRDSAEGRHGMTVRAVYWRRKSVQDLQRPTLKTAGHTPRSPATSQAVGLPAVKSTKPLVPAQAVARDEIEAFRRALRQNTARTGGLPSEAGVLHAPESHSDFSALSETQHGKL
jgi:acyl-homoserine lactone acylase PvdQ